MSEYLLQHFIHDGCFSRVARCQDRDTKDIVALKILKKRTDDSQEPRELTLLKVIRGLHPVNIVRFYESFKHMGKTCLTFELLDKNLHQLLRERRGEPLSLQQIRATTEQLLAALRVLKTVGVFHANVMPQNIMVVNQKETPFRVKLIDFSSAIKAAKVQRGVTMQPVAYSIPFPQHCQYYLMKAMVETLDQPEDQFLHSGIHTLLYFSLSPDNRNLAWRLKMVLFLLREASLYMQDYLTYVFNAVSDDSDYESDGITDAADEDSVTSTHEGSPAAVPTDLYDPVTADEDPVTVSSDDEDPVTVSSADEDAVTVCSADKDPVIVSSADEDPVTVCSADEAAATPAQTDPDEAAPADLQAVMESDAVSTTSSKVKKKKKKKKFIYIYI
ncbi:homeodomain-interacting protein kinase 2-like [Scomber scombrus]|uniref:Homeodomain-interacting protein kinase 2-like n=1 Tax=Scomber scombrus TaxID=13677 RepID=A0AAV1PKC5_SCOSC